MNPSRPIIWASVKNLKDISGKVTPELFSDFYSIFLTTLLDHATTMLIGIINQLERMGEKVAF